MVSLIVVNMSAAACITACSRPVVVAGVTGRSTLSITAFATWEILRTIPWAGLGGCGSLEALAVLFVNVSPADLAYKAGWFDGQSQVSCAPLLTMSAPGHAHPWQRLLPAVSLL